MLTKAQSVREMLDEKAEGEPVNLGKTQLYPWMSTKLKGKAMIYN